MSDHKISVTLTKVGVQMGDHSQDIVNVLDVDPDMTLAQLVEAELTSLAPSWDTTVEGRRPEPDNYLVIRIARKVGDSA